MLTKIALLAAVAQAVVTPGNRLGGTAASPTQYVAWVTASAETATNNYANKGYACVRKGWVYAFPMATTANNAITVPNTTQTTTINSFWPTTVAQLGTVSTVAAGAAGDSSGCYSAITTAAAAAICATSDALTPNRLLWLSGANYAADIGTQTANLMINVDFVLAVTYQDSFSGTGTRTAAPANYCDVQVQQYTTTTTTSTMTTTQGLNGTTKCTYILNVAGNAGAPAFKITNMQYWKFQLGYVEWSGDDLTGKFLATNLYTGTVAAANANVYPTPIRATYPASCTGAACIGFEWPVASAHDNWFPDANSAGNIGNFVAYANYEGSPFLTTTVNYDSGALLRAIDAGNAANAAYTTLLNTYNTSKDSYNTALANEKTRAGDFFKSIFEAPVKIPTRPCPPTQPAAWTGPNIDWWVANAAIASVNSTVLANNGQWGVFSKMSVTTPSLQSGWLAATPDNTATPVVAAPGHTFGLRGQGNATNAMAGTAFAYRAVTATATHGMMVSIFPYDGTDANGLTSGQTIVLTGYAQAWRAVASFNAPVQPAAAVAPNAAGAAYLVAGAAAVAAVAATMF